MFWEFVWGGIGALEHWQTWGALAEYMAICLFELTLIGKITSTPLWRGKISSLAILHIGRPFRCIATFVFLWTLAPILLKHLDKAAWAFPWLFMVTHPFYGLTALIAMMCANAVLRLWPVLDNLPGITTLIIGWISLGFLVEVAAFPGLGFILSLLLMSGVLMFLGLLLTATVVSSLNKFIFGKNETRLELIITMPVAAMMGFIPVFIYADWLGRQM